MFKSFLQKPPLPAMEKRRFDYTLIFSVVFVLGLVSFVSCIAAELHRTKTKDLKLDGKLCYLPESKAFGFGIAALVCLIMAQAIGNYLVCRSLRFNSKEKNNNQSSKKPNLATILLLVSWASFSVVVVLLSTASSMSRRQPYTAGWLDGECYLVKGGVYISSAILILITTTSTLGSAVTVLRKKLKVNESTTTYTTSK